MPTLKRKPNQFTNKVYSSVKILSTTTAIDSVINHVNKSFPILSSSSKKNHQDTNSIIRSTPNDVNTISGCNIVIETGIAPSLSLTSASTYCHERIKCSGPDRLSHVDSAILITPEKRTAPYTSNLRTRRTNSTSRTITSAYKYIPLPLD